MSLDRIASALERIAEAMEKGARVVPYRLRSGKPSHRSQMLALARVLHANGKTMGISEVCGELKVNRERAGQLLSNGVRDGCLVRVRRGEYRLPGSMVAQ